MEVVNELRDQLQQITAQIQASEERSRNIENEIARLQEGLNQFNVVQTEPQFEDITIQITSADQIQMESYKSIPEFSGNKNQYRSWRNQVMRQMGIIADFKTHPKYGAALGIIRAKITGAASDVLTNNKTAFNIDAIIKRLDSTYADQRPLYVVEAEMTSIKQLGKNLQEFHDAINQALNTVITKIVMTYKTLNEQEALVKEAQQKAVRTFIVGLRNHATRNILYSHQPKTLEEAFTTAQTVYFDNQYWQLDHGRNLDHQKYEQPKREQRSQQQRGVVRKFNNGILSQPNYPTKVDVNCNQQTVRKDKPEVVDPSNRFKQNNWQQPYAQMNGLQKRDYKGYGQQPQRIQRINQLQDNESDPNEGYEGDICGDIPDDLISNSSHETNKTMTSSAFLDE